MFLKNKFYKLIQIFLLLGFFFSLFSKDSPLLYLDITSAGFIQQETKRVLCIYGFRKEENSELELNYLENGIPEILYSNLRDFDFIYEPNPIPEVIVFPFNSKEIKNQLSRSIFLEKKLFSNQSIEPEEAMLEGAKQNCEYVISGKYLPTKNDKLKIRIFITNRINGNMQVLEKETSIRRAFQELTENSLELKRALSPKGLSELQIDTNEKDVKVIIDGIYYGNTPFTKKDLTPDQHKITLEKDQFETLQFSVTLDIGKSKNLKIKLKQIQEEIGYLNVNSNPQGAEVFFGNKLLGVTPLVKVPVKVGNNRVRISLENYVDEFRGVDIKKEEVMSLNVQLKEGETKEYYKKRFHVFQDYTYFDFSLYSLYGSLIFYTTYMYSWHRIGKEKDKLYAIASFNELNTFNQIQVLTEKINTNSPALLDYQVSILGGFLYQQLQVNKTERNVNFYKTIQNISVLGAIGMLSSSIIFYNLGINSDAMEFGYLPKTFWSTEEFYFSVRFSWN